MEKRPPVRIAHAYGNSARLLHAALAVPEVDSIEADIWYHRGDIHVRHERRALLFPILYDGKMRGHRPGPYSLRIGRYFVRPDFGGLHLNDLLRIVNGRKRILLDIKGRYDRSTATAFAAQLARQVRHASAESWVAVCGQTYGILNRLRRDAPWMEVRYSVEREAQWQRFLRKVESPSPARRLCIAHQFFAAGKQSFVEQHGIDTYCWTVDDAATAVRLVRSGASGIISNDLRLLSGLHVLCAA